MAGIPYQTPAAPEKPVEEMVTASAEKSDLPATAPLPEEPTPETGEEENVSTPLPAGPAKIIRVNPDDAATPGIKVLDPAKVIQEARVAHIPEPDLIEDGQLPNRAEDGRRPFDVYQRAWSG